jgi:positive regulator of sigma E activity
MVDGSAALVYMVSKRIFFVVEILGEKMADEQAIVNMLGGVKVKVSKFLTLGIGYQQPVTSNKEFTSQYVFQPSSEWK